MKVVSEETWSWMLFQDEATLFLSVVCGGVGIYTRDIRLTPDEVRQFTLEGMPYVIRLADKIRTSPEEYGERHLRDFHSIPGIDAAALEWRAQKAAKT